MKTNDNSKKTDMETNNQNDSVRIYFPASLVEKNGIVTVSINQGGYTSPVKPITKTSGLTTSEEIDAEEDVR